MVPGSTGVNSRIILLHSTTNSTITQDTLTPPTGSTCKCIWYSGSNDLSPAFRHCDIKGILPIRNTSKASCMCFIQTSIAQQQPTLHIYLYYVSFESMHCPTGIVVYALRQQIAVLSPSKQSQHATIQVLSKDYHRPESQTSFLNSRQESMQQ